jgi:hypothetical protein
MKTAMGVWQGIAMGALKFHPGYAHCPTLLRPAASGVQLSSTSLDTPHHTPMHRRIA